MMDQEKKMLKLVFLLLLILLQSCDFSKNKKKLVYALSVDTNYVRGELQVQHGMALFNQHCAACHNFTENEIGPNLSGITSAVEKDWLVSFINDPTALIKSGDERAVGLYNNYKLYMPSFSMIKDKDLEDLLGFIHKFSEAEKKSRNPRSGGLLDPITDKISDSDYILVIEELLTVPPSSENIPRAKINKISGIVTASGERLFVADLRGKLYEILGDAVRVYMDLKVQEKNFIDHPGWAAGLGSFAFHPEFEHNGLFYTIHTEPAKSAQADFVYNDSIQVSMQGVLSEWKADDPSSLVFSGSRRELLRVNMVTQAHGLQEITFNPLAKRGNADYGLLYLGIGDGGSALSGFPYLCNSNENIWGSVIRIDPLGRNSANGKYGIPTDNPYANQAGKLGEIWCRGFRNPHRISWDESGSGKMFITNIGQHSVEEVNLGMKGADYGWPIREGTFLFDVLANPEIVYPLPTEDKGYTYPVAQYDHDEGNAVSGGFVYNGSKIPNLKNKYIFGDIPRGTLFYSEVSEMNEGQQATVYKMGLQLNGELTSFSAINSDQRIDLRFGKDSSGTLYIFTKSNGKIYKVIGCKSNTQSQPL